MTVPGITFAELLADNEASTAKWQTWFEAHPQALEVLCDVAGSKTVRELVHHIFTVELRHAQRLLGETPTVHDGDPDTSLEALFALHEKAAAKLQRFLAHTSEAHAAEVLQFTLLSGRQVSASRRKVFAHIMVHGIRHWAQISTLLRQNGLHVGWHADLLNSPALV
jgi:uncharacterized damage-inducible protein DinB